MSALSRMALRQLWQHRLRSALTVVTITAAVTGLWLFAIPLGLDGAMTQRQEVDRVHDIRLSPNNLHYIADPAQRPGEQVVIDGAELQGVGAISNVAAVEARPMIWTQIRVGGTITDTWLVGVEDFADQVANLVSAETGVLPTLATDRREVLLEWAARDVATVGDEVAIRAGDGEFYSFVVTGFGGTLHWNAATSETGPTAYVPAEMVRRFTAAEGFNSIELRLVDGSPAAAATTLDAVRSYLEGAAPEMTYQAIPDVRRPGSWEGRDQVFRLVPLLYVLSFVALASALILVATTMNTIVSSQTREIGVMKALGASKRSIMWCYLRGPLLLAAAGTALGSLTGALMSDRFGRFVQQDLGGIRATWSLDPRFVVLALVAGVGGTVLASLPALRRAVAASVHTALRSHGISTAGRRGLIEKLTGKARFMTTMSRLGLRNTSRRRGRSFAASAQVALGVGVMVAFGTFSVTALAATESTLRNESGDLEVSFQSSLFADEDARRLAAVPGVKSLQAVVYSGAEFGGDERVAWGLPAETIYRYDLAVGRWFTPTEADGGAAVGVIGAPLAAMTATELGDRIEIGTPAGVRSIEVIGIDESLVHDGRYVWLPLATAMEFEQREYPNVYWVETVSSDPTAVDRVAAAIRASLGDAARPVTVEVRHEELAAARSEDRIVVGVIQMLGLPIVAIGMIGLVCAMTTNVLERTREIGILRAVGARARHVRKIFAAEGTAIAVAGWVLGIPIGYGLARLIVWFFGRAMHTSFDLVFPLWLPLAVLAGVLVVARLTLRPPLRRAVRLRPELALRYE